MAEQEHRSLIPFEDRSQPSEDVWQPEIHRDTWCASITSGKHQHFEIQDLSVSTLSDYVDRIKRIGYQEAKVVKAVKGSGNHDDRPVRTWSASICEIGDEGLRLKCPLTITLEDYGEGEDIVASWPEVEAWGSGSTDSEAINALKDEIVTLFYELLSVNDAELGKLPKRWKRALMSVVSIVEMDIK